MKGIKGLAVMVLVVFAVFYLAQMYIGILFGAIIAIILFVLCCKFNIYQTGVRQSIDKQKAGSHMGHGFQEIHF